ncbi:hypothetical protein M422DRAFT_37848, partial [Sphaerobolus stellatus SS14]
VSTTTANTNTSCLSVDPQQLQKDHSKSLSHQAPIQHVLSIIDALTSLCKSSSSPSSSASASVSTSIPATVHEEPQHNVLSSPPPPLPSPNVSSPIATATASQPAPAPRRLTRPKPTSALSGCSDRIPFTRKVIGGSCAGKTEPDLCRWTLTRNHFVNVRYLDPTMQSKAWLQDLKRLGWEHAHPYYQARAAAEMTHTYGALTAFSGWVEDDFDYDGTEYMEGEYSDEEEEYEEGEIPEEHDDVYGQTRVWDSRVPLHLPAGNVH